MTLSLTVLGSGTGLPDPNRGPAGLLIRTPAAQILVDGGSGTLQQLARTTPSPLTLDAVVYSHRHPDHCSDLVPILFARRIHGGLGPLPVFAATGFGDFLNQLAAAWGPWVRHGVDLHELTRDQPDRCVLTPDLSLHHAPARHGKGALHLGFGSPVEDRPSAVFSGDTGPSEALVELAADVGLLVCECASPEPGAIPGHLSPDEVVEIARRARPRQIWLTHFYPQVDPNQAVQRVAQSGIPTRHAADGDHWTEGSAP